MRKTATKTTTQDSGLQRLADGSITCKLRGRSIKLHSLDLNDLAAFEQEIGPLSSLENQAVQAQAVRFVLWRSILHDQPEATIDDAGRLFGIADLDAMGEVVSALFQPEAEAGAE
jgi:hypothetical protein